MADTDDEGTEVEGEETEVEGDEGDEGNEPKSKTKPKGKTYTQEQIDAIVKKRLARAQRKSKQKPFDQEDPDDDDGAEQRKLEARLVKLEERLVKQTARAIAADLDVDPRATSSVIKLADLDGIDPDDTDAITDAIEEVLENTPAFKKAAAKDADEDEEGDDDEEEEEPKPRTKTRRKSTRDDTNDAKGGAKVWTRAEIARVTANPAEYEKNRESIQAALAAGTVKA